MIRKVLYPRIEGPLKTIAIFLKGKGLEPNHLTLTGVALSLIAGLILGSGSFIMAGLFVLAAGFCDLLDGALARTTKESKYGAFLDSVTDRFSDFFIIGGIMLYYVNGQEGGLVLLTFLVLLGALLTSYTKARMECFQINCTVGLIDRPELLILIALGALVPFLMIPVLWVLALFSLITVFQRIWFAKEELAK
jgi:CDP-diacylglycerol---glycerol-3-phosphate 3-phosphatidyltransferase